MSESNRRFMEDKLAENRGENPKRPVYEREGIDWALAMKMMGWSWFRRWMGKPGVPFTEDGLVEMVRKYKPSASNPEAVARSMIEAHVDQRGWAGCQTLFCDCIDFYTLIESGESPEGKRQYQIRWWNCGL